MNLWVPYRLKSDIVSKMAESPWQPCTSKNPGTIEKVQRLVIDHWITIRRIMDEVGILFGTVLILTESVNMQYV